MVLPVIGITMGDPTGIGPEVIVKALTREEPFQVCRPVVLGGRGSSSQNDQGPKPACHG
jgi:4-hydroxy-L-threonine phosphate dehydrogenase PdxA